MAEPSSSNNANTQGDTATTHSGGSKRKKNKQKQNYQQSQEQQINAQKKGTIKNPATLETESGVQIQEFAQREDSTNKIGVQKAANELGDAIG